jgi:anti-sigma regulatory factor (Ser/Thr protein kinase)
VDGPQIHGAGGTEVIRLDADADAPARGRHAVTVVLARWGCAESAQEDLLLVVSELVTNAVVHGAEPIVVTVTRAPERVRVEVTDGLSDAPPHNNRAAPNAETGRGLSVVTRLAVAWGWRASPGRGKTVWAEVPLPPRAEPSRQS